MPLLRPDVIKQHKQTVSKSELLNVRGNSMVSLSFFKESVRALLLLALNLTSQLSAHALIVPHAPKVTDHLAAVFTTFSGSPRKAQLSNTVKDWASFLPTIQPTLFFTEQNSTLTALAESHGWMVAPCPRVNKYGTPFLKNMYTKAYQLASAPLYGFINCDILFDQSLLRTLHHLIVDLQYLNSILMTGRRWNYRVQNETSFDAWTPRQVQQLAKAKIPA